MTKPAARVRDNGTPPHTPPKISPGTGSPSVEIGSSKAWRANLDRHICMTPIAPPAPATHGPEACYLGSFTVLVNNQMAVRVGDMLVGLGPPNPIMLPGCATVLIGDIPFGLADQVNIDDFCAEFRALVAAWGSMTNGQRRQALQKLINKQLAKSGVPKVKVKPRRLDPSTNGQLDFNNWNIDVNKNLLSSGSLSSAQARGLANTLYHEARHAEQWFAIARSQASGLAAGPAGSVAQQLSAGMGIPGRVGAAAAGSPLPINSSPQAVMGQAMNQSVYDSRSAYRNQVLNDLNANPQPPNAYDQYRALPEEIDAWNTGDATGGCGC